jgi:hypothetical protein
MSEIKPEIKLTPRHLSRLFNEPEAEIVCNSRRIYRCLETVINTLENLRLLDYFDIEKYNEVIDDTTKTLEFLYELERKYPIRIVFEDIDL